MVMMGVWLVGLRCDCWLCCCTHDYRCRGDSWFPLISSNIGTGRAGVWRVGGEGL